MEQVRISVRNLVESILMTGDIGSEVRILSPDRAEEGSRVHRLHQKKQLEENSAYQKEVFLKQEFEYEDLAITVEGRADGLVPGEYLEEIKSTYLDAKALESYENPLHWAQLKFYGYMYLVREGLASIRLKLTYFQIDTEETVSFETEHTLEDLTAFVDHVIDLYGELKQLFFRWRAERNASLSPAAFPFPAYRPGQREMAVSVYGTIREGRRMFIQAPTGIGKTISAIYPSVKALGEGKTDRIFYLTPKGTGKQIGEESVDLLRRDGARLRSLTLTSKEKICFMEEANCNAEDCPYARGYYDKIHGALKDLLQNEDSLSRAVLEAYAKKHTVCPFEYSLDCSLYADIIIGDYNYAFDPRVYLRRFFDEKSEGITFLVDEAHNLLDRARSMFSAELSKDVFDTAAKDFGRLSVDIADAAAGVSAQLGLIGQALPESGRAMWQDYDAALLAKAETFRGACEKYLQDEEADDDPQERQAVLEVFFTILGYLRITELYGKGHLSYAVKQGQQITYKLFCIHPGENLKMASQRADSIIFFSATLTPMDYYMDLYGGDGQDYRMALPSPFPKENLTVFCDYKVDTRYKVRAKSLLPISDNLAAMLRYKKGNYTAFFPSYAYMRQAYDVFLAAHGAHFDVKIQEPGLSEADRSLVLAEFDAVRERSFLYFMVLGGVFAEGIDLKGERLIGSAIIGLGYPQLDYERDLIMAYFDEEKGEGFHYAYTYPGLNKVTQAAGRVIRGEDDQGIILLMDTRYRRPDVFRLLPPGWFPIKDAAELKAAREENPLRP